MMCRPPRSTRTDTLVPNTTLSRCRVEMARDQGGWWSADVAAASPGSRYGFSLDGGEPRPDPRSQHQPDGVDGLSAVVAHDALEWHEQRWRGVAPPGPEIVRATGRGNGCPFV